MSRLMFLVAMVAASAMFSCGSDGNVSSTDDSSLGDNSVPDNTPIDNYVEPDNPADISALDSEISSISCEALHPLEGTWNDPQDPDQPVTINPFSYFVNENGTFCKSVTKGLGVYLFSPDGQPPACGPLPLEELHLCAEIENEKLKLWGPAFGETPLYLERVK